MSEPSAERIQTLLGRVYRVVRETESDIYSLAAKLRSVLGGKRNDVFRDLIEVCENNAGQIERVECIWADARFALELSAVGVYSIAGYLELCRIAGTVAPAKYRDQEGSSHCVARAFWVLRMASPWDHGLEPSRDDRGEERDVSLAIMKSWIEAIGTNPERGVFDVMDFELLEALRVAPNLAAVNSGVPFSMTAERINQVAESIRLSAPISPKDLVKRFNMSWDSLKPLLDSQKIKNEKLSSKSYRIHLDDLPSDRS